MKFSHAYTLLNNMNIIYIFYIWIEHFFFLFTCLIINYKSFIKHICFVWYIIAVSYFGGNSTPKFCANRDKMLAVDSCWSWDMFMLWDKFIRSPKIVYHKCSTNHLHLLRFVIRIFLYFPRIISEGGCIKQQNDMYFLNNSFTIM